MDKGNLNVKLGLAMLSQKEGKLREAIEHINELMNSYPDDATLYVARADIESEMNHNDLALIDLEKAIELAPSDANAYTLRAEIYLLQVTKALVIADFEQSISLGVPISSFSEQLKQCQ